MNSNTVFFTGDTHFGHKKIVELYRQQFTSPDEMDEALIKNWNLRINHGDNVFHLGDFSYLNSEKTFDILKRLSGNIYLIRGNHEGSINSKCKSRFITVNDLHEIYLKDVDIEIVMCHYPMLVWNKSHYGAWHLHGHSHGTLKEDKNSLRMDVGVDCSNLYPLSFTEIKDYMKDKKTIPIDHHTYRKEQCIK